MECFFYQGEVRELAVTSWFDEIPVKSDFVPYFEHDLGINNVIRSGRKNVKMRLVEMLKKMSKARMVQDEKNTRHVLRERLRRQSQKKGYVALHALLPKGTKCDKISVIRAAALEIIRTRRVLEDLQKRNAELKKRLAAERSDKVDHGECSSNVKMCVEHPEWGLFR